MSGLKRKLEGEIEIRESAGDVYHEIFKTNPHHFSNVAPHFIESCDVHEGEHGKIGTIVIWKYKLGGKPLIAKNIIEEVDKENKLVRHRVLEGDLMEEYKTFIAICQVIPKDKESSVVKWTLEYEKLHPGIPEPTALLDAMLETGKHVDDHHHGIKK